jgi:hypothetical protein
MRKETGTTEARFDFPLERACLMPVLAKSEYRISKPETNSNVQMIKRGDRKKTVLCIDKYRENKHLYFIIF